MEYVRYWPYTSKVTNTTGQATHGARKHAWHTQAASAKNDVYVINGKYDIYTTLMSYKYMLIWVSNDAS